jgi:PadR family transcriptional regulator PadR
VETLYPALFRLEQKGWIRSAWGLTDTKREARFYRLTAAGRRQLGKAASKWDRMASLRMRVLQGTTGGL